MKIHIFSLIRRTHFWPFSSPKVMYFQSYFCTFVHFWVMEIKEIAGFFYLWHKAIKCWKFSWFINLWHMVVFSLLFPLMLRFRNFWVHFACCATKNKDFRKVVASIWYTNSFFTVGDLFSSKWKVSFTKKSYIGVSYTP